MDFKIQIDNLSPDHAFDIIMQKYGVSKKDLTGTSRLSHLVRARKELIKIWSNRPFNFSSPYIGFLLNRDHTTILHHKNKK